MSDWREVNGYPDYQVSRLGVVKRNNRILAGLVIKLRRPNCEVRRISRGKLILETWLGPARYPQICYHIDNDKTNFAVDNLKWVYPGGILNHRKNVVRSDGRVYPSLSIAANDVNSTRAAISLVCRGYRDTAAGYGWKYQENIE